MASAAKPDMRPANPNFSSGPCAKRPGFTLDALAGALLGRSHRAAAPKARLAEVIDRSRAILRHAGRLAARHRPRLRHRRRRDGAVVVARPPRRRRGRVGRALAPAGRPTSSSSSSCTTRGVIEAPYGRLPAPDAVDFARDVVFAWNGTTSGVRVPNADGIPPIAPGW